ncbi:TIGR00366 family protein [Echinicola shivajiensis]|uniref:TIGR00366 family protein n=1 Tax=Echinicola shivajiensis TaxID=1035916 RepID=UPI001FEC185A|nr:TIGR00366 family protein [Echinicola shivajiensis]
MNKLKGFSFPTPFDLALALSAISILWATMATMPEGEGVLSYSWQVLEYWKDGFWSLLEFTLQMVLILVFGHALAISAPVSNLLSRIASVIKSNSQAVMITGGATLFAGYLNWGFGLILGAMLARKIGERAVAEQLEINYPLVAASGYLGMMVWHGGFSGSAPLKVAEEGHFLESEIGVIPVSQTILSSFNLSINLLMILGLLLGLWLLSKKKFTFKPVQDDFSVPIEIEGKDVLGWIVGGIICVLAIGDFWSESNLNLSFISLNYINFLLLGFGLVLHKSIQKYVLAIEMALRGAAAIVLQFPFYAGILGVFKLSGLLVMIAGYFVTVSSPESFPLLTFFSAALINLFVPSGGGQWAVQGPVIVETALQMGLSVPKMIMVMAYGDQLTNMLQPFWALPLLAITGVAPRDLLRYTVYFFLLGLSVLILGIIWAF